MGWLRTALLVASTSLASRIALADPVVETYGRERPADVTRALAPLRRQLEGLGHVADPAKLADSTALPHRVVIDRAVTTIGLRRQIDSAIRDANHGRFEKALATLEGVFATVHANTPVVVADPDAQDWMTKAYVFAAFSQSRLGHEAEARETIAEQIRSFPEYPVTTVNFGIEAEQLYGTVRKELDAKRRGALLVVVNRPDAQIYIDEAGRGRGGTFTADVLPGRYRVLVQYGGVALTYEVTIDPAKDRQTELDIDWDVDAAWITTDTWVGAVWPDSKIRSRELAQQTARRFGSEGVITISAAPHGRSFGVTAKAFSKAGAERWACEGELDGSDDEAVRDLAACATSGRRPASRGPIAEDGESTAPANGAGSRWPVYAAGAGSLLAIAGGIVLLHVDGGGACGASAPVQCDQLYETRTMGWGAIGVGVAAAALGGYFYLHERPVEIGARSARGGGVATLTTSW